MRADLALVARGLARSRTDAQRLIADGRVSVNGASIAKPAHAIAESDAVVVDGGDAYVSRAAHKLAGALDACAPRGLVVAARNALDAGASTGGFTQVLLERGAAHVTAVDVGHGQLVTEIAADPRVTAMEGLNVRDLKPSHLRYAPEVVVADLSFISLTLAIPPLVAVCAPSADVVVMVKPQFEVGRDRLGKRGVVTLANDRARAVAAVVACMRDEGLGIHEIVRSALPGPAGNLEFFVWGAVAWQARTADASRRAPLTTQEIAQAVERETGGRQ